MGNFTKRVHKAGLQSLLTTNVLGTGDALSVSIFVKAMKQSRKTIFHKDDVPQIGKTSQIHGVCLQMIAGEIISLKVTDHTKVGKGKITESSLSVVCPNRKRVQNGYTLWTPGFLSDECWEGFNLC